MYCATKEAKTFEFVNKYKLNLYVSLAHNFLIPIFLIHSL